ncbi:hypothetical protein Hanom_Chr00s033669g01771091 [Helianthus anomalus]
MAARTRSHSSESALSFTVQNQLKNPEKEICSFDNADSAALRASGAFPDAAFIRPFNRTLRSDVFSKEWICFSAYPFSLGLRVLILLNQIKTFHVPDLCIEGIPIAYRLRSHGNSRFSLFSTSINPFILKVTKNEYEWKRKFFFVRRDSIAEGDNLPVKWLTTCRI